MTHLVLLVGHSSPLQTGGQMTDLVLLPDAEKVVSVYLRSRDEVTDLIDDHVWTDLPALRKDLTEWRFPGVRLTRIGGSPALSWPLALDAPVIQVDVWGGPKATARRIAETCRAVLAVAHLQDHDDAIVYGVAFGPMSYLPDDDFTPPKPRYTFDVTPTLRPLPGVSGS